MGASRRVLPLMLLMAFLASLLSRASIAADAAKGGAKAPAAAPAAMEAKKMMLVDADATFPSGGSRAPLVFSGGGKTVIAVDAAQDSGPPAIARPSIGILTPSPVLSFTGMTRTPTIDGGFTYKPPDTHHAVGAGAGAAGRIVHVTNKGIQIYDKSGSSIAGPTDLDAFLTALGAAGLTGSGVANLSFDPKVLYDQHSGRFFVVILDGRTPNPGGRSNIHVCTSKSSTPGTLTTTDWSVESASALTFLDGAENWFDYPGIGADATRLVITGNLFDSGSGPHGSKIRVFLKSSLTDDGVPAGATFNDINTAGSTGFSTVQPAHVFGSTLNGDFYLVNRVGPTSYRLWQVTGAGGAASLVAGSPSSNLWTAGAQIAAGAPQTTDGAGNNPTLATLSARIQNAVYRSDTIWLALASDTDSDSQTEVAWFAIDPNSTNNATPGTLTTPTIVQSGAIDGSTAADWTFLPAIGVNGSGDVVITYSESNATKAAEMRIVARFVSDAPGTFQSPVVVATGAGEYDDFNADNPERWGDYAAATVDPDDDETFWVSHEVCQTAASGGGSNAVWGTRIARLGAVVPVQLMRFDAE